MFALMVESKKYKVEIIFPELQRGFNTLLSYISKVIAFFFIITLTSCSDNEVDISPNEAPPDGTIENVKISNYVNRVYIAVLGREADSPEQTEGFNILRSANVSLTSRMQFLDIVFSKPEYNDHLYTITRADLLQSMDTINIPQQMSVDTFALTIIDSIYRDVILQELVRLDSMRNIPRDLENNNLDIAHLHSRCVNNYFYDQLNMGTTEYELTQSKNMVDGISGILFLQSGMSKNDFLNIFFSSQNYFEGLSLNLYIRYLGNSPSSIEMSNATQLFLQNHDYKLMQKNILSKNEYVFK
jgi:hypothetical protein